MTKKYNKLRMLGSSQLSKQEREKNDFYATDPKALEMLLSKESFDEYILEPACGMGHLSEVLKKHKYKVLSFDLIDRGYSKHIIDFLSFNKKWKGDIITNPPYSLAKEFVEQSLKIINTGNKVAMFLKIQFLEGKARRKLFDENPPKKIYISSSRIECAKNGNFELRLGSAISYAWFIWEKGFKGSPKLYWFN